MSWLFGVGNKPYSDPTQIPSADTGGQNVDAVSSSKAGSGGGGGFFGGGSGNTPDSYRFDSAALEKAAAAAKELEKSSMLCLCCTFVSCLFVCLQGPFVLRRNNVNVSVIII